MQLVFTPMPHWPQLAWVAICPEHTATIEIRHGRSVEVRPSWCVEGVWDGPFAEGGFDATDLIFGSGVRLRHEKVVFVSAGSPMDKLVSCQHDGRWVISNSLPALLAATGLTLVEGYRYEADILSIRNGLTSYTRILPLTGGTVRLTYYQNLEYDGHTLREEPKPSSAWPFPSYKDYTDYLLDAADRLGENLRAPLRCTAITPFVPISSGYDSPVAAILARQAGCRQAGTIRRARSRLHSRSDSGEAMAHHLGLPCQFYTQLPAELPHEAAVWAIGGRPDDLNLTIFDYPGPLTLLVTGVFGDTVWSTNVSKPLETEPMVGYDMVGAGLGEYRLAQGLFNCPVPFWGIRQIAAIRKISASEEMAPWRLNTTYDRPIPRRLIESTGMPRGSFAVRKSATSISPLIRYPLSPSAQTRFRQYVRSWGHTPDTPWIVSLLKVRNGLRACAPKGVGNQWWHCRQPVGSSLLFHWAIHETTQRYCK